MDWKLIYNKIFKSIIRYLNKGYYKKSMVRWYFLKFKNNNNAVTEVIGTMILLLIAVSVVTLVFYSTVSSLTSDSDKIVDIVGRLNPEENEANFAI